MENLNVSQKTGVPISFYFRVLRMLRQIEWVVATKWTHQKERTLPLTTSFFFEELILTIRISYK